MDEIPAKKKRVWLRRAIVGAAVCMLLVGLLFIGVQTPPVKRYMANRISATLSQSLPWPTSIEGVGGLLPFSLSVDTIALGPVEDPWLSLHDATLNLGVVSLFGGTITVDRVTADYLSLHRLPPSREQPDENEPLSLPEIAALPDWVRVNQLQIAHLNVDEAVAGQAMTFSVNGAYRPDEEDSITLQVDGEDTTDARAALTAGLRDGTVHLALDANDSSLLQTFGGVEGPFALSLSLTGPLSDAVLSVEARRADIPLLALKLNTGYAMPLHFTGTGQAVLPEDLTPPAVRERFGSTLDIEVDAEMDAEMRIQIRRSTIKAAQGTLDLTGTYDISSGAIALSPVLRYDDLHRLAGQPREGEPVALTARVPMEGTLPELHFQPEATLNNEAWVAGEVTLDLQEAKSVRASLQVFPAGGLVPEAYRALLAEGAQVDLDASYAENKATIREARVAAGNSTLDAQGNYDTRGQLLDLIAELSLRDLHDFEGIAQQPLAGSLQMNITASGDATQTTAEGKLQVENLTAATIHAPSGNIAVSLGGGTVFSGATGPGTITQRLETTVEGAFPGMELKPGLARDLTLKGSAVIEELRRIAVSDFALGDGNLQARADGQVDVEARTADFTADLEVSQLGDYEAITGQPWRGEAALQVRAKSGDAPGVIHGELSGKLAGLAGFPDMLQGLVGDAATLSGRGDFDGDTVRLETFEWASQNLEATANGQFNTQSKQIEATLGGKVADISAASTIANRTVTGTTRFNVAASGAVENLSLQGNVTGGPLRFDALHADSVDMTFSASGIPTAIELELQATLEQEDEQLALSTQLRKEDALLTLDSFHATSGANALSGAGTFNLELKRGHGKLRATLPELAALKTWLDMPLEGALDLDVTLDKDSGRLSGTARADHLVLPDFSLATLAGDFDIDAPFEAPSGRLNLSAESMRSGAWDVASLSLKADGPAEAWRVDIRSNGEFNQLTRFNVDAGGVVSREAGSFRLDALQLGAEEHAFTLRAPTTATWHDGTFTLSPFAVEGDSGGLEMAGTYAAESVDIALTLDELPLRLVELAGVDPPAGTLSGSITVMGSPAAPILEGDLQLAGYIPDPAGDYEFAGLDAVIKANYATGTFRAAAKATVPDAAQLTANADLAAQWTLTPWRFSVAGDQPLQGAIDGTLDLATVPALLALEGHDLRGDLAVDLVIAGTPSSPALNGSATITDGYYENGSTSTILNDIEATLQADGNALRLTEFAANDGAGGTFSGEGQIVFQPDGAIPFDLLLELDHPRLVYRDDLRAQGGGTIRVQGDENGATISGDLVVSPANITLPERTAKTQVATVPFTVLGETSDEEAPVEKGPYPIMLNIKAELPGRIFFRGPGLDSEWQGSLAVTGNARIPAVRGTLNVKKGRLDFLGREFDLAESTINFDGESPPAPYLRITAVAETGGVVARVRMEGLYNALNLSLESEPPLPRDEILSRVLFGQRLSDVSPVQALTLARYAPIFSKNATAQTVLGSGAPKPFLVDRLSVRGGTGVGEASITTGKYLNDDFYLEFEQGLGSAQSLVSLEWIFAPQWSLKGRTTSQGEGGLGVFWKKNY